MQLLDLPPELLLIRLDELKETYHFQALARLNICNRFLHHLSSPIFWQEVHFTRRTWKHYEEDFLRKDDVPRGWKYTE
jgi:hypothetical protein